MKKLSEVTIEDAKKILNPTYSLFFNTGRWKLTDESKGVGEPVKKLYCKNKSYMFWFFDDCIDIELIDWNINFDNNNFDVKINCYVEAYNLGYKVRVFYKLKLNTVDWEALKEAYFNECTNSVGHINKRFIKFAFSPCDLFNWFKAEINEYINHVPDIVKKDVQNNNWLSFDDNQEEYVKLANSQKDFLVKFENGKILRFDEEWIFGVVTHFKHF